MSFEIKTFQIKNISKVPFSFRKIFNRSQSTVLNLNICELQQNSDQPSMTSVVKHCAGYYFCSSITQKATILDYSFKYSCKSRVCFSSKFKSPVITLT